MKVAPTYLNSGQRKLIAFILVNFGIIQDNINLKWEQILLLTLSESKSTIYITLSIINILIRTKKDNKKATKFAQIVFSTTI